MAQTQTEGADAIRSSVAPGATQVRRGDRATRPRNDPGVRQRGGRPSTAPMLERTLLDAAENQARELIIDLTC